MVQFPWNLLKSLCMGQTSDFIEGEIQVWCVLGFLSLPTQFRSSFTLILNKMFWVSSVSSSHANDCGQMSFLWNQNVLEKLYCTSRYLDSLIVPILSIYFNNSKSSVFIYGVNNLIHQSNKHRALINFFQHLQTCQLIYSSQFPDVTKEGNLERRFDG